MSVLDIRSRDNAQFKDLRRLAQDNGAYRRQGRVFVEGDHLCRAALARGWRPAQLVCAERAVDAASVLALDPAVPQLRLADALWAQLSVLESPAGFGLVLALPQDPPLQPGAATVVLDRLQDAGNVGSILRSAAAFGFRQVLALRGTAGLWSPKVLRAGMGAHFGLRLIEGAAEDDVVALQVPLVATSSHHGGWLHEAAPPHPCAWLLGHEGQGVSPGLLARAASTIRIRQPGGEESLNVAAAAAICLHASAAPD
ncbi:TrmH family RNA methyltransferase [Pseudorhodoferax sp.]|uniref:TrmH family RNA methyltransferase n=1 Tax=Pseudorhodoferax sp. TaxID=1993553 RepID=UPI0039E4041F